MSPTIADPPPAGNAGPVSVRAPTLKSAPWWSHHEGWVYLLYCDHHRLFKLGCTRRPRCRPKSVAQGIGRECVWIHAILTNSITALERYFHELFQARRLGGEWFFLSQADVNLFRSYPLLNIEGPAPIGSREEWLRGERYECRYPLPTNWTFEVPA